MACRRFYGEAELRRPFVYSGIGLLVLGVFRLLSAGAESGTFAAVAVQFDLYTGCAFSIVGLILVFFGAAATEKLPPEDQARIDAAKARVAEQELWRQGGARPSYLPGQAAVDWTAPPPPSQPFSTTICAHCGTPFQPDARACLACGKPRG